MSMRMMLLLVMITFRSLMRRGRMSRASHLRLGHVRQYAILVLRAFLQSGRYRMARDDPIDFESRVQLVSFFMSIMD